MTTLEQQIEAMKQELLAEMDRQVARLKGEAQKLADESTPKEWPQEGDWFWCVSWNGFPSNEQHAGTVGDMRAISIGNVFRTEAEALQEIERRKVLTEYRKLARESWQSNSGGHEYYSIRFCGDNVDVCVYSYKRKELGVIYFPTYEAAESAIQTIGADSLKLLLEA